MSITATSYAEKVTQATQSAYEAATRTASAGTEFVSQTSHALLPQFDETAERFQATNDKLLASAKTVGLASLDAYDKVLESTLEFENKVADSSQVDWLVTATAARTKSVADIGHAYTAVVRELLK